MSLFNQALTERLRIAGGRGALVRECKRMYVSGDESRLRDLAMLVLFASGFTCEDFRALFGVHAGHARRRLALTRDALAARCGFGIEGSEGAESVVVVDGPAMTAGGPGSLRRPLTGMDGFDRRAV